MPERASTDSEPSPVYTTNYDGETGITPTEAVIEALAAATDSDPVHLPPLYDSIEPDALNKLVEHDGTASNADQVLGFTHHGWHVYVRGNGDITVCDSEQRGLLG